MEDESDEICPVVREETLNLPISEDRILNMSLATLGEAAIPSKYVSPADTMREVATWLVSHLDDDQLAVFTAHVIMSCGEETLSSLGIELDFERGNGLGGLSR